MLIYHGRQRCDDENAKSSDADGLSESMCADALLPSLTCPAEQGSITGSPAH